MQWRVTVAVSFERFSAVVVASIRAGVDGILRVVEAPIALASEQDLAQ
jgi:hypothetical protein